MKNIADNMTTEEKIESWKTTLEVIQEGDLTYIVPHYNVDRWEDDHSAGIKRASSVVVLDKGVVTKNVLDKAYLEN